ncbi:hypothetical protein AURDEDRAFT_145795 [Auricularia subglabra TFB-10046 SS5]|nr:hypothetical protein AURDEDRAFT_145795 [Auricularia subglabra TFB-10046 SS5]
MRLFLGCIPVRGGTFVLSFLMMLITGAMGGLTWYEFIKHKPTGSMHVALIIAGAVFSAIAFFALLGFLGSLTGSFALIAIYSTALYAFVAASLAAGIFLIVSLFINHGKNFVEVCVETQAIIKKVAADGIHGIDPNAGPGDLPKPVEDFCFKKLRDVKIILIVVLVITVLIEAYCAYIVRSYAAQLAEEESGGGKRYNEGSSGSTSSNIVINNSYAGKPV